MSDSCSLLHAAHDEDDRVFEAFLIGLEEVQTVTVGQGQVEQHDVGPMPLEVFRTLGEIFHRVGLVATLFEALLERPPEQLFVFDDQDQRH